MKRNRYLFSILAVLTLLTLGCEKKITSEDDSKITYYVDLNLLGDALIVVPQGGSFSDPGFTAVENGEDVSSNVVVDGEVNTAEMGYYPIEYIVENKDGFAKSAKRDVFVTPSNAPETDLSGSYTGQREGKPAIAGLSITKIGPGLFFGSDMFGGHYEFNAGYGLAYRLRTYFVLNSDNTISSLTNTSPWGPWDVLNGVYNPETKVISYRVQQGTFGFNVTMTLEQ